MYILETNDRSYIIDESCLNDIFNDTKINSIIEIIDGVYIPFQKIISIKKVTKIHNKGKGKFVGKSKSKKWCQYCLDNTKNMVYRKSLSNVLSLVGVKYFCTDCGFLKDSLFTSCQRSNAYQIINL